MDHMTLRTRQHAQVLHAAGRLRQVHASLMPQRRHRTQRTRGRHQHPQRKPPPAVRQHRQLTAVSCPRNGWCSRRLLCPSDVGQKLTS
jgi:hypothetical protein